MKTNPVGLKEPFVVAGCGQGRVLERKHRDDCTLSTRITNADRPRTAAPVADDMAVAACSDDAVRNAVASENRRAIVDRVSLGKTAQIDTHALARKVHRAGMRIENQVLITNRRARDRELRGAWFDALAIVVQLSDAGESDVERTLGHLREADRPL